MSIRYHASLVILFISAVVLARISGVPACCRYWYFSLLWTLCSFFSLPAWPGLRLSDLGLYSWSSRLQSRSLDFLVLLWTLCSCSYNLRLPDHVHYPWFSRLQLLFSIFQHLWTLIRYSSTLPRLVFVLPITVLTIPSSARRFLYHLAYQGPRSIHPDI